MRRLMSSAATRPVSVAAALGLLLTMTAVPASAVPPPRSGQQAPAYFHTLPPGAKLPSGAQCARWVHARPIKENKGVNRRYNHTTGQHVARDFLAGDEPQADKLIVPRINGNFTGTTAEILRWAARS